ncbi:Uncharacterised protein [Vibrio cholerae]|uniref:Uncharacterized protein n=1 Tax=Vibrio cholerae TaxID=666 RepID=A0A655RW05_VIBCL|nr:Uncharacterised protein [Vibrio cholerae]
MYSNEIRSPWLLSLLTGTVSLNPKSLYTEEKRELAPKVVRLPPELMTNIASLLCCWLYCMMDLNCASTCSILASTAGSIANTLPRLRHCC